TQMSVNKFVGTNLHIELVDGRLVEGVLAVVDPFGNLLLSNVYEIAQDKIKPSEIHRRELGLVSVPSDQLKDIFLDENQLHVLES
ncbi:hypothetical protein METBIDRAFT_44997, partial [Metschnikowia bicuspidata var. bicuspidata NRRL YB-4993]